MEKINAESLASSGVERSAISAEGANATGVYTATCYDKDGNIKWTDTYSNLVTNVGKADLLDKYLAGSTYTANWYLGLVDGGTTPTYNAADTLASHAGWSEIATGTGYTTGTGSPTTNRGTPTWNAASATGGGAGTAGTGTKTTAACAFAITGTLTIAGTLLCSTLARGTASNGGAGILYSVGSFTGGNKSVANGDTLNVTYQAQV